MKYICEVCGYVYGNTDWDDLPEDYVCPVCGAGKDAFSPE